jgi:flavin prenyltransferase
VGRVANLLFRTETHWQVGNLRHHKLMKRNIVVAITGASGSVYAVRLLEVLHAVGCDIHLIISPSAKTVFKQELDLTVDLENFSPAMLMLDIGSKPVDLKLQALRAASGLSSDESSLLAAGPGEDGRLIYYHYRDFMSAIASGSFLTDGMVICPCSGGTLSAIVRGASENLIHRAAEVHFKERRKLILVPRETPLSMTVLENMKQAAQYGAVILPAMPGFYHGVKTIGDLIDFVVARILDQLGIPNALIERWGGAKG